jgi:hypothetical protein
MISMCCADEQITSQVYGGSAKRWVKVPSLADRDDGVTLETGFVRLARRWKFGVKTWTVVLRGWCAIACGRRFRVAGAHISR